MIGLTTGRQTSQRLNSLLKDLAQSIPRAKIMRRGKSSLDGLATRLLDEGLNYALALYRWHGGPGRIDFFEVRLGGITPLAPSILLSSVKLRREYGYRGRSIVEGITYDPNTTKLTQDFSRVLSRALDLPEPSPPISTQLRSTLHISEKPDKSIHLVVTSPPVKREVGPKLVVSRLLWDLDDSGKDA